MAALKLESTEEKSVQTNEDLDDVISEKVKIESAKQQLRLEKILTFKFQEMIENKMADIEIKTETKLLSKYGKDFKNLEEQLHKQMKSSEDFHRNLVIKQDFLKLKDEFKHLKRDLNKDLQKQSKDLKKDLEECSKNIIDGLFHVKCDEIERTSFRKLEMTCQKYSEDIKNHLSDDVELKLRDEAELLKEELKKDFLTQNEKLKKNLQETSKAFIEGIVEATCEDFEKKSFNNLIVKCQNYSEGIKKDLNRDLEMKLQENVENERNILLNELKSELNIFKKHFFFQIYCGSKFLSKIMNVIKLPRSSYFIWEIEDFKDQLVNDELSFESVVFHLYEIGCKVKFIFHLRPLMYFEVNYVDRPSDKVFPFNGHHRITFILHDQVDNQSHKDFIRIFEPTFGDWANDTLFRHLPTKDQLSFLRSRWLKNGTIQVKVQMEPFDRILALEPRHYGHFIWKIHHFKDVRESYQYGRQRSFSEAFYSSEKGYRMKGRLYVAGKVYFRLFFLKGRWDKELPETFKHRTTISLISQKDQSELKDKTISKESDSTKWDAINDFTEADLQKYVKDDSLIISLKVDAL